MFDWLLDRIRFWRIPVAEETSMFEPLKKMMLWGVFLSIIVFMAVFSAIVGLYLVATFGGLFGLFIWFMAFNSWTASIARRATKWRWFWSFILCDIDGRIRTPQMYLRDKPRLVSEPYSKKTVADGGVQTVINEIDSRHPIYTSGELKEYARKNWVYRLPLGMNTRVWGNKISRDLIAILPSTYEDCFPEESDKEIFYGGWVTNQEATLGAFTITGITSDEVGATLPVAVCQLSYYHTKKVLDDVGLYMMKEPADLYMPIIETLETEVKNLRMELVRRETDVLSTQEGIKKTRKSLLTKLTHKKQIHDGVHNIPIRDYWKLFKWCFGVTIFLLIIILMLFLTKVI